MPPSSRFLILPTAGRMPWSSPPGSLPKKKLSVKGFADAPATFRDTKAPQYVGGSPNPEARVLGGVLVRGAIERGVTINLVALRGLRSADDKETAELQKYLFGLALIAA